MPFDNDFTANPPDSQEGKSGERGMTYIDRLNQFNKWVDNNYPGDKVISLYIRILNVFNQRHWPEWAGITTPQLMALLNTSNPNVALAARNKLVEAGFLEYRPGHKGVATTYKLLNFVIKYDNENSNESAGFIIKYDNKNSDPIKNKIFSKSEDITPSNPPTGGTGEAADADSDFDRFWEEYPRKQGKGAALKAYRKARKKITAEEMLSAVRRQKASWDWTKDGGQYVPQPATWLNQERWSDELRYSPPPKDKAKELPSDGFKIIS